MKVLILENDDLAAQGLVRGLGYLGCTGIHVRNIAGACAMTSANPDIALAFIDVELDDGESGEDFCDWVEFEHPAIVRVLISGLPPPATFVEDPPHQLFMRKPFGQRELVTVLQALHPSQSTSGNR